MNKIPALLDVHMLNTCACVVQELGGGELRISHGWGIQISEVEIATYIAHAYSMHGILGLDNNGCIISELPIPEPILPSIKV